MGQSGYRYTVCLICHTQYWVPTQKPESLYRWLIERYCPVGGTVLDPTFGSGNSVFTAYQMDRNAIGIEKDDGFYKKAEGRLDALVNQSSQKKSEAEPEVPVKEVI